MASFTSHRDHDDRSMQHLLSAFSVFLKILMFYQCGNAVIHKRRLLLLYPKMRFDLHLISVDGQLRRSEPSGHTSNGATCGYGYSINCHRLLCRHSLFLLRSSLCCRMPRYWRRRRDVDQLHAILPPDLHPKFLIFFTPSLFWDCKIYPILSTSFVPFHQAAWR